MLTILSEVFIFSTENKEYISQPTKVWKYN